MKWLASGWVGTLVISRLSRCFLLQKSKWSAWQNEKCSHQKRKQKIRPQNERKRERAAAAEASASTLPALSRKRNIFGMKIKLQKVFLEKSSLGKTFLINSTQPIRLIKLQWYEKNIKKLASYVRRISLIEILAYQCNFTLLSSYLIDLSDTTDAKITPLRYYSYQIRTASHWMVASIQ